MPFFGGRGGGVLAFLFFVCSFLPSSSPVVTYASGHSCVAWLWNWLGANKMRNLALVENNKDYGKGSLGEASKKKKNVVLSWWWAMGREVHCKEKYIGGRVAVPSRRLLQCQEFMFTLAILSLSFQWFQRFLAIFKNPFLNNRSTTATNIYFFGCPFFKRSVFCAFSENPNFLYGMTSPETHENENDPKNPKSVFERVIWHVRYFGHLNPRNTAKWWFSRLGRCEPHFWTQQGAKLLNGKIKAAVAKTARKQRSDEWRERLATTDMRDLCSTLRKPQATPVKHASRWGWVDLASGQVTAKNWSCRNRRTICAAYPARECWGFGRPNGYQQRGANWSGSQDGGKDSRGS